MNNKKLKRGLLGGLFWKFAERICAQLVSLVVSIILARILIPDDYSVVSIITIFFTFCNVIISGGLNTSLIQKKDSDVLDYSSVLYISLGMAAVLYVVMFFSAPFIARLYDKEVLVLMIRIMAITFFVNALKAVLSAYISSTLQFRKFFYSTIIGTIISAFIGIWMASQGFGAWALIAQQMSNGIIDTCVLLFTTKIRFVLKISWGRLKGLLSYGWKIFVASIISVIYEDIRPLIVGLKFSPTDLAYYNKGNSFPGMLNSTISDTLSAVLFPVMSKVQDSKEEMLSYTRHYMRVGSFIVFPLMAGFAAVAENFVSVVLTDKWLPIVPYIYIFCITHMFNIIQTGNLQVIRASGRSDIILKLEIIKKTSYLVILLSFIFLSDSPIMLAASGVVCTAIASLSNAFPNRKLIGYTYMRQIIDMLPNLLISILMFIVVYVVGKANINTFLLLVIQILVGVGVYIVLSILTKNKNLRYINGILVQLFCKSKHLS